jgi:hypothetical protein
MCPILDGYGVMTVFYARTRPRVNRSTLVISTLVRYLKRAGRCGGTCYPRAVHNRAAACVAVGGGIFENQL